VRSANSETPRDAADIDVVSPRVQRLESLDWARARAVHDRLFPVASQRLLDLECSGITIPADGVGGDLYDFLRIGSRRAGIVLADVAGHGLASALLMATLRATLRSDYDLAPGDLVPRLERLNRTLHASTAPEEYATLFLGEYETHTQRLRYVNCGHVAPILLRSDGQVHRLQSTATALGMFDRWDSEVTELTLSPEDLLVLVTDGIVEARSATGEEFGEERVLALANQLRRKPLQRIQDAIIGAVARFSASEQADDRTLVVARLRERIRPMKLREAWAR
jgi:phosphoserine phosphatase RsbU/P